MASITSLGVHKPSALPFLIAEGILPPDPSVATYKWQCSKCDGTNPALPEEELLTTQHCVVWSRGGIIERVYHFDVEEESVTHAVFTYFPVRRAGDLSQSDPRPGPSPVVADQDLRVRKTRTTTKTSNKESVAIEPEKLPRIPLQLSERGGQSKRALVVVLKTQAHVFILSENSFVVHLPYEVDAIFPSTYGILLQRKTSTEEDVQSLAQVPPAPKNTFAYSQSDSSIKAPDFQMLENVEDSTPLFAKLLNKIQEKPNCQSEQTSSLVCLTDPLTEIGAVLIRKSASQNSKCRSNSQDNCKFTNLDPSERLVYLSSEDELSCARVLRMPEGPLTIAVTQNIDDGTISVWDVTCLDRGPSVSSDHSRNQNRGNTLSRRRSSYTPGGGTGTTTPLPRSHRHPSKDPGPNDDAAQGQEDVLDHAFENSGADVKASRRQSSLLARADLSTIHDRSTFTDPLGANVGVKSSRRGASFGMQGTLSSASLDPGASLSTPKLLNGIRTSLGMVSLSDPGNDTSKIGLDDPSDLFDINPRGPRVNFRGQSKDIIFSKLYSMPSDRPRDSCFSNEDSDSGLEVFAFRPPNVSLNDACANVVIGLCFLDRVVQQMTYLILNFNAKLRTHQPLTGWTAGYSTEVTGIRRTGVIDACKVTDGACCRMLVLRREAGGLGVLSLEDPWSLPRKVELPSPLSLHDPYQITNETFVRLRGEGGYRRIISPSPRGLIAVQNGTKQGRADAIDSDGVRHRIQIKLVPRDHVVFRVINVAQAVLPATEYDSEAILRGWWDAIGWLRTQPEQEDDEEWIAISVLLLSLGITFLEDRRKETSYRQKKRKGGLLRSSSGAHADLENWEAMLSQETSLSTSYPIWMQQHAWDWTRTQVVASHSSNSRPKPSKTPARSRAFAVPVPEKSARLPHYISLARDFLMSPSGKAASGRDGFMNTASTKESSFPCTALASILVGLHLLREEFKLDNLAADAIHRLTPLLAQIGGWLGWQSWAHTDDSYYMQESTDLESYIFDDATITGSQVPTEPFPPPSIMYFIERLSLQASQTTFISLLDVASSVWGKRRGDRYEYLREQMLLELTPRTVLITGLLASRNREALTKTIAQMASLGVNASFLETIPEGVAIPFRAALAACQANPSTDWDSEILQIIGRYDIAMLELERQTLRPKGRVSRSLPNDATRDVHNICSSALETEVVGLNDGSPFVDRQSITRLLFKDDQRFTEATKLVHPLLYPVVQCTPEPEWSDTDLLEAQQELAKVIAMRTLSVSPGRGLLFYNARLPLLTEKFPVHGFSLSCVMKPTDTTVTADRTIFTEEKVSWAFFHAGVEAGLSISRDARGVDTSWILFNKPRELNNRHAGFLLAMGLNGHLKSIAKWVAFKYLTPKHTMTSIGLLLGLSASYMGTMDSLITRLLSVHVTRMLPPGAAELNLSPLTQTSGIMGIGLLYCNTQHRRMSEIMLSEMENEDEDDSSNPLETLRDEGYRLAAGFALGFINLGQGKDLKGLHDMHITERLLTLAVATKNVDVVHVLDKATPGATLALALIFLKAGDEALARKIDIPNTTHQFDYVRPDMFLIRTLARHLIMWDEIQASRAWMRSSLPLVFRDKKPLPSIRMMSSEDTPFLNALAGLCLSVGLRFAGSASIEARDLLCSYLDEFIRICKLPTSSYDGKLARTSIRNCQDVIALAVSCVMAGTGDLHIFRRLRSLHGRTNTNVPYGSHLAAHFAIGILFLGGGTHTFGTSNIAVASLLCAFYPLFPNTVLDNKSHLQAFRHFWVLAAERRCLVVRDADTYRPIPLAITISMKSGEERALNAPCVLPELETVVQVRTSDPNFWNVTLRLASNSSHSEAFRRHQSIYVRRRAAYDAHTSVFSATMQALNHAQPIYQLNRQPFEWIFKLASFASLDRAAQALVLPIETSNAIYKGTRGTVVDDQLVLEHVCLSSGSSEKLWSLRLLFAWMEDLEQRPGTGQWLGVEVVDNLKAGLIARRRAAQRR